ncbi:MAG: TonB-dependent receptor plug domain-containing protein, partial [Pseudomonadales bacterium]|nr:TonB-dependent receptor plug domain-containing protein [Pseudomonadales bacterium]
MTDERDKIRFNMSLSTGRLVRVLTAVSSILSITLIPTNAVAQDKEARGTLEEVVVTAQKRGVVENAQDVPVATYGFSGYALQDAVVVNLADLGELVPAADLPPTAPIRGYANFTIRGMGTVGTVTTEDPTVSIVVDGMPLGISAGGVLDVHDLESAEVLAGPQGTLFGRNTTGGAVVLRTRRPSG